MTKTKTRADARTFRGLPVEDAKVKQTFRVVDEDGGTPGDPNDCRAQHALDRAFPGAVVVIFKGITLIEMKPGKITRYDNSPAMRKAIQTFDDTGEFPAGDYILNPVPAHRTLAARSAENRARKDARKGRVKQSTNSGLANGKPPVFGRGRPTYDKVEATPATT